MYIEMISYILALAGCEHIKSLNIKNTDSTVNLYHISNISSIKLNDTQINIEDCSYMKFRLDSDFQDVVIFTFYSYDDYGDAGMDLTYQFSLRTKLSTLNIFKLLSVW